MNRSLLRPITGAEIDTYQRDGVVCLREMFDRDWVDWLRDTADTVPGEYGNRAFLWPFYDSFRELAFDSPVGEIAATMMGSRTCGLTIDIAFIKDPHSKSLTPWHHDKPYYQVQGEHVCGMWIGLDKATAENGAMEWIKGSHKWQRTFEPDPFDGSAQYETVHPGRERMLDIESDRESYDIVMFETEPGDCIVDHALVLHSAGDNTTDQPRRAITYALYGDRSCFASIPPSRGVEDTRDLGLSSGDSFPPDHPLVPQIWPKRERSNWPAPTEWGALSGSSDSFIARSEERARRSPDGRNYPS